MFNGVSDYIVVLFLSLSAPLVISALELQMADADEILVKKNKSGQSGRNLR